MLHPGYTLKIIIEAYYLQRFFHRLLKAAIIQVEMFPTAPSAFGLSFGEQTLAGIMAVELS